MNRLDKHAVHTTRRPLGRALALMALALGAALFGAACGGFSSEEAEARCTQEEEARAGGGCFDDTAYDECVVAFEECGSDVVINDGCPLTFTCPD